MASTQPLDWIREIKSQLVALDEKPQFGTPTPFDEKRLENDLRTLLNRPDLTLKFETKGWMSSRQVFEGLSESVIPMSISWAPLSAPAFFVTDENTLKELMAELFVSEKEAKSFYDAQLVEGFYAYFAAELLRLVSGQQFGAPLKPRLGEKVADLRRQLGEESCFAIDVYLNLGNQPLWGRILLSESFRQEWKTYFVERGGPQFNEEMGQKLMVDLGLEVGRTSLRLNTWKKVKKGDFVLLDHCSYDPEEKGGAVLLTLNHKPLLRGRLKKEGIKITNYPVYEEVSETMPRKKKSTEENLYGDLDDEEELEDEMLRDLKQTEGASEESEEAFSREKKSISPNEIPIDLIVEVGRVRMSAASLMQLGPGNLVELNVAPEQGVDLVVNGKKVGRGELIRMGDVLGVRILTL